MLKQGDRFFLLIKEKDSLLLGPPQFLRVTGNVVPLVQIDQFEAEIETLGTGKKKKSRDNADQIEEYQNLLERHRDHVQKLETLLRMLDNDNVNIDQVSDSSI